MGSRREFILRCLGAVWAAMPAAAPRAGGAEPGLALDGYDVVAYFRFGRATKGSPEFQHDWDGSRYYFASADHRASFETDPDRYTPRFSGLCAVGVSFGKRLRADPEQWSIVDGRLYLFSSARAREVAERDPTQLERSAQKWQAMN